LGNASYVAREIIGEENIVSFTVQPDYLERFSKKIGAQISAILLKNETTLQLR
ncbi:hypothetical protein MNBD_GAMMA12-2074, partial [hydrothermal vent metagenome]